MIATPLFADQNYNAAIIEHKGTGIYLDLKKVTTMTVINALNEVLESDRLVFFIIKAATFYRLKGIGATA